MMQNMQYHVVQDAELVDPLVKTKFANQLQVRDLVTTKEGERYQFVGFIIDRDKVLVSFPKHTFHQQQRRQLEQNPQVLRPYIRLLFHCIKKTIENRNEKFAGIAQELNADYPFMAFLNIYRYFKAYGLFTNEREVKKFGYSGKISWKDTIQKSPKVIQHDNLLFLPLAIRNNIEEHVFISKCMAYAIDSTLEHFSLFLEGNKTGMDTSDIDFRNRSLVISKLRQAKRFMFKNIHQRLVDSLLSFFEQADPEGGNYQLKILSFHLIWESMVGNYLRNNFLRVSDRDELEFSDQTKPNSFNKKTLYPDIRGKDGHSIEPDYYWLSEEDKIRYIFDAKYYQALNELDYKQVSYYFLLKHYGTKKDNGGKPSENIRTYSALILPTEDEDHREIHFELNPLYNLDEERFVVITQYLNMIKVMRHYTKI